MKNNRKIRARAKILPKGLQDFLLLQIFFVAQFFIWLTTRLSEDRAKFLMRLIFVPASRYNRKLCQRNLATVFRPLNWNPAQLGQLYRAHLEYMIRFQVETARCFSIAPADFKQIVSVQGEAHLQATLKKGRGVLLVSGHAGTWWHVPCFLAAQGYKLGVVFNSFPYARIENYMTRHAHRHGIELAFVDKGVQKMVRRASRENEIAYLTFDVAVRKKHANWVPFGRTKININPGPAILALRYQIPVLFVSSHQGDDGRSHVIIHPEVGPQPENPDSLCRLWAEKLYADILLHPEQWWGWGVSDLPCVRIQK
jgi:Kdo2-lipid IVA lauroyltransferase/acyltransferase